MQGSPMSESDESQEDPWRWLNWSIVIVFAGAVIMISVISAGVFDPKPLGSLLSTNSLQQVGLAERQQRLLWIEPLAPASDYSLRLTAALSEGELDSAYGLALGAEDQYLVVAFSPVGYVSFWRQDIGRLEKIIPWRTWPHVHLGSEPNELWMDVQGGQLTSIRTNREILWQGAERLAGAHIGLWAETFAGPTIFDFRQLEIFAEPDPG